MDINITLSSNVCFYRDRWNILYSLSIYMSSNIYIMKICIIVNGWTNCKSPYSYLNSAFVIEGFYVPTNYRRESNMISIL